MLTAAEGDDGDGNPKIFKKKGGKYHGILNKLIHCSSHAQIVFVQRKKISKQFSLYTPRASAEMNCDKGHSTNDVKVEERKRPSEVDGRRPSGG